MEKIIALVDFSTVSDVAIAHAGAIRKMTDSDLTLLHVTPESNGGMIDQVKDELMEFAKPLDAENIPFKVHVGKGEFFDVIQDTLTALEADVVIVGTHGMRGRKRNLYSDNIVRLINKMAWPTLVVQGHKESTPGIYKNVLIPVLGKVDGVAHAELITGYTSAVGSKLHVLNFVNSDYESEDEDGKEEIIRQFKALGVDVEFTKQYTAESTQNYGLIIEELAHRHGADLIVWTKALGEEAKQMSAENKTNLILNKYGIPALLML